jgi:Flp pilus assembly protein TadD
MMGALLAQRSLAMAAPAPRLIGLLALALALSIHSAGALAGPAATTEPPAGATTAAEKVSQGGALLGEGKTQAGTKLLNQAVTELLETLRAKPDDPPTLVLLGTAYTRLNRADEALPLFLRAAKADPSLAEARYGAGQAFQKKGQAKPAVDQFQAAAKLNPKDWRVHAKLVQLYQAAGNTAARDAERTALLDLRQKGEVPEVREVPRYCRDQFTAGRRKIMAYEYFDLKNPGGVQYAFHVLDEKGAKTELRVNLASDETITKVAREQGEIGKDDRMYQVYSLAPDGEAKTYESYKAAPSYDAVKKLCIQIASGKATSASEAKPASGGDTITLGGGGKMVVVSPDSSGADKPSKEKKLEPVDLDREKLTDP